MQTDKTIQIPKPDDDMEVVLQYAETAEKLSGFETSLQRSDEMGLWNQHMAAQITKPAWDESTIENDEPHTETSSQDNETPTIQSDATTSHSDESMMQSDEPAIHSDEPTIQRGETTGTEAAMIHDDFEGSFKCYSEAEQEWLKLLMTTQPESKKEKFQRSTHATLDSSACRNLCLKLCRMLGCRFKE
jgi:hypothetical protein